ncbi:hypothetical protein TEA_025812 [Camellia sinensis var. sinensis]|uniref:Sugar phosphate transporter domain-containing protein n=1 Tax=Camellia sinensis var. sinensis TaxID=542762 RepID=A0A4V3WN25_CAMSN|nr:hypothetical protein TEA_025812 [Camellia sinensis var. sinensis]
MVALDSTPTVKPLLGPSGSMSSFAMKTHNDDEIDVEDVKLEKGKEKTVRSNKTVKIHNRALVSGLAYCISSCSMILVNKYVLSSYDFNAGISLMFYQNLVSVVVVSLLSFFGVITTEPLTWRLIKTSSCIGRCHIGYNLSFVSLVKIFRSLKYINVAMVTVLKNVTNVITAVGEMYLFNKHHDNRVWVALFLMIVSAISGGITDISFHAVGYAWQLANCFLTASYSLMLRRIMDTAKQVTKSGNLNEFSMVLLNNTLSLPLGLLLIAVFNEVDYLSTTTRSQKASWYCFTCASFKGSISLCLSTVSIPSSALVSCCGGWGNYRGSFHGGYCNRGSYGGSCRGCSRGSGSHDGSCGGGSCGGSLSGCGYRKCDHCGATIHTKPWC